MIATIAAALYCLAMALASRLVPMCPCCPESVRISRIVAAIAWVVLAGALFALPRKRFHVLCGIALLSGVQVANFWEQMRHDEMSLSSFATQTLALALLGATTFAIIALFSKPRAAAR
ncbi:MAG: hypothetical protein AAB074_07270 [Planctomycetota bacterium]